MQTFDAAQLARMGRLSFGDSAHIRDVIKSAHDVGMTVSADLLFNLPQQPLAASVHDVMTAADMGFDQICIYNLVLYPGLGTVWSLDSDLVAALPGQRARRDNWLALRGVLAELGYEQTTLTNFERGERRFMYEAMSFQPERYDGLGFGPGAITQLSALKWQNAVGADPYRRAIAAHGRRLVGSIRVHA